MLPRRRGMARAWKPLGPLRPLRDGGTLLRHDEAHARGRVVRPCRLQPQRRSRNGERQSDRARGGGGAGVARRWRLLRRQGGEARSRLLQREAGRCEERGGLLRGVRRGCADVEARGRQALIAAARVNAARLLSGFWRRAERCNQRSIVRPSRAERSAARTMRRLSTASRRCAERSSSVRIACSSDCCSRRHSSS